MESSTETKTYYTYKIQVTNKQRVQIRKLNTNQKPDGEPTGYLQIAKLEEISLLLQAVFSGKFVNDTKSRELGECLFDTLFDRELRHDFFETYYKVVRQGGHLLKVELDIDEYLLADLAALPWEFMVLPASANLGTIWLATNPNIAFSRRCAQPYSAPSVQLSPGEKLRIALAVAAPDDEALGNVAYKEVEKFLLELAEKEPRIELLPIVETATPKAIDQLIKKQPHIFHFIGHGRLRNDSHNEVGEIALVDDNFNDALWLNSILFSELFSRWRQPGIVLLQACEGGKSSASKAFVGIASRIVRQNIPVVVAMQHEISNHTACLFARCFYEHLANEFPVDNAAQEGRYAIALSNQYRNKDFSTPVIFMRVEDGTLFPEVVWETLDFDEKSARKSIERINTCVNQLGKPEHTSYVNYLTPDEYKDLVVLNSKVQKLKDFDRELKKLAKTSERILEKATKKLTQKIEDLSYSQQEKLETASSKICTEEQLRLLNDFKGDIKDAKKVAAWIDVDLVVLSQSIGKYALKVNFGKKNNLSEITCDAFFISIEKFLGRIIHCLEWGKSDILDRPGIILELDEKVYSTAFERLREMLPADEDRFPPRGVEQFDRYIEYLINRLQYYENVSSSRR